jgi:hypothetical protein
LTTTSAGYYRNEQALFDGVSLLQDKAYYFIYAEFDDENGKCCPVEDDTLGQAWISDSKEFWDMYAYTADNLEWNNLSSTPTEPEKKEEPKAPATTKPTTAAKTYGKAGQLVNLVNVNFYASSDASKASGKPRKGKYYLWSAEVVNGRIRITNNKKYIGVSGKVTAWINVKDITATKEEELVIKAGAMVVVKDKIYYSSSSQKTSNKTKSGTLYFYDGKAVNGKYRMTSKKEYCGKKPVGMYTTCWMKF